MNDEMRIKQIIAIQGESKYLKIIILTIGGIIFWKTHRYISEKSLDNEDSKRKQTFSFEIGKLKSEEIISAREDDLLRSLSSKPKEELKDST